MLNKVVARYVDGPVVKGTTADFFPNKEIFHLSVTGADPDVEPIEVRMQDLKALFFVKDYEGDAGHVHRNEFDPARPPVGRAIRVQFKDGEVLVGTTTGYQPGRPGFFLEPADAESNIERCYVVSAAAAEIGFI